MTTTKIKEHPIIFNGEMVRAILDGRKTMTRRVMKPQPLYKSSRKYIVPDDAPEKWHDCDDIFALCPYGIPGDLLWVREGWGVHFMYDPLPPREINKQGWVKGDGIQYKAGPKPKPLSWGRWRSSIHMTRLASRITLEVVSVRVERVQDITEGDAVKEGVIKEDLPWDPDNFQPPGSYGYVSGLHPFPSGKIYPLAKEAFQELWNSINGPDSWELNPWVWRIEFKVVKNVE